MTPITTLDFISCLGLLFSAIIVYRGWKYNFRRDTKLLLCGLLFSFFAYSLCNLLEWTIKVKFFDTVGDFTGILIPVMWVFFFYALLEETSGKALRESEKRYRDLFENSPISLWEEDFSEINKYVQRLKKRGVTDIARYLEDNPEAVRHCARLVKIIDVNQATLNLYQFRSKKALKEGLHVVLTEDSYEVFKQEVINLAEGKTTFEHETVNKTSTGHTVHINFKYSIAPGHEQTWSKVLISLIDITERKKAEEAVIESEEKYRTLVENLHIGIYRNTPGLNGRFVHGNPAIAKMFCYDSVEDFMKISVTDLYQDPAERKIFIEEILTKKIVKDRELPLKKKDGTPIWASCSATAHFDGKGKVQWIDGVIEDITERKKAEDALRESEARLLSTIENLPFEFFAIGNNGQYILQNSACKEHWGDLIGKRPEDITLLDEDIRNFWIENNRRAFSGRIVHGEVEYVLDGKKKFYYNIVAPIKADAQLHGILGINMDITYRKQAEKALRQSEAKTKAILNAVPDLMFQLKDDGTFLSYKGSKEDLYTEPDSFLGKNVIEVLPAELASRTMTYIKQTLQNGEMQIHDYELPIKGILHSFEFRMAPTKEDEVLIMIRNITERKKAEAEKELLIKELENKNKELEQFTYSVSHDLKSPLVTIEGFLEMLELDTKSGNTERMKDDIKRIMKAVCNMHQLLNELLELSRIGRVVSNPEKISLEDLAYEVLKMVSGQIKKHKVKVTISDNLPPVYGERSRIFGLLQNLIENAAKFMGDQPKPRIKIGVRTENKEAVFYVEDNGMGIEPKYHEKIFGLFEKLQPNEGTGVGLALVKKIVEVHGGRIWVESKGMGQGSTFYFTIPTKPTLKDKDILS